MQPAQKNWDHPDEAKAAYIQMDGQSVFKFAVRRVPEIVEELLEKARIQKEEISYFFYIRRTEGLLRLRQSGPEWIFRDFL